MTFLSVPIHEGHLNDILILIRLFQALNIALSQFPGYVYDSNTAWLTYSRTEA